MNATCATREELDRLMRGTLASDEQARIAAHLEGCTGCQGQLEKLAAGDETWEALAAQAKHTPAPAPVALAAAMAALQTEAAPVAPQFASVSPDLPSGFFQPPKEPGHLGRVGQYEVIDEVGRGAMGIVLRASDERLKRVVALKVMSPQLAGHAASRKRFIREGQAAAAVCHEHVVRLHAVDDSAGLPYMVMEFIGGQSLQQRIDKSGPLQTAEILRIGMQAASGLAAAHAQGLVHRDIKPANILLENGIERVKITDFGLARAVDDAAITQTGVIPGTPQFMAPEQARGEAVDHRADLFSLGCVMYTMCTSRPPFRAATTMGVLRRICEDDPRPIREINPDIPDWLAAIVAKLLVKDPAERFQSAAELGAILSQCLAHLQQPDKSPLPLVVLPSAPAAVQVKEQKHVERERQRWLFSTPAGILVLLLAAMAPLAIALGLAAMSVLMHWLDAHVERKAQPPTAIAAQPTPMQPRLVLSESEPANLDRLVQIAEEQCAIAKKRYDAGLLPRHELIQVELQLADARLKRAQALGDQEIARQQLAKMVALRQEALEIVSQLVEAGVATPSARLEAEIKLLEAKQAAAE